METKDWIYTLGLILTFGVSLASLIINIKNRKNAMREYVYKEHFTLFLSLNKEFNVLLILFFDVIESKNLTTEKNAQIENQLRIIESHIDIYYFLIPNKIFAPLYKVEDEGIKLYAYFKDPINELKTEDILKFNAALDMFAEEVREFIGIDPLSDENKKLIG